MKLNFDSDHGGRTRSHSEALAFDVQVVATGRNIENGKHKFLAENSIIKFPYTTCELTLISLAVLIICRQ